MQPTRSPRIVYCGMFGALSRVPLAALLDAGFDVRAVVVPVAAGAADLAGGEGVRVLAPPSEWSARPVSFAALLRRTIVDLAWERGLPVLEVGRWSGAALAAIGQHAPDLIAVSCFPFVFPPPLLALPPLGVLNLHPALLPRGRGPDPLFWAFREHRPALAGQGGVTIHLMDTGLDSGPIVAQGRFDLSDGMRESELELRAAALGAELLVGAIRDHARGIARPMPQEAALATTYPLPAMADFVITPDRPARWAFNFLRGTAGRGVPHRLVVGDRQWLVRAAQGYDPDANLGAAVSTEGATLRVQCTPGVLAVRVG
jgi:methionyl-tRNA formyltransferase